MYFKYYKAVILIAAAGFVALMTGCGGQQNGNQQQNNSHTEQANQKTTQRPASGSTTMQGKERPHGKNDGMKGKKSKAGSEAGNKSGQKAKGESAQKTGGKSQGKTKGKSGNARITAKGFLGMVRYGEGRIYFDSRSGKIIPLTYNAKHLRVTLDGKKARVLDLKQGQRARVVYVSEKVRKKDARRDYRYVARSIKAYPKGGKKPAENRKSAANG